MADEKKKEPVKYKFGENEFDLERYIKNIDANVASYMERQNWNEGQKQEFMNSYNQLLGGLKDQLANNTNRFSTNSFGSILDSQGLLSNTDNDNIDPTGSEYYYDTKGNKITTDDYNTLKKKKQKNYQTFSANRAVATYFDKIGRSLLEKMKLEEKPVTTTNDNSFNFGKHGFVKWWQDKYNPGGGTLDGTAILELDQLVDGKRARTNRSARLAQDFTDYIGSLSDDLDFSKTRFKDKAGYTKFLNDIVTKINDGLEENDLLDLSQAGVGRDFLEPFLSTDKTVTVSDADRAAEEAKKKADAEALQKKEREDAMRAFIENQQALSAQSIGNSYSDNNWFTVGIPYNEKWYNQDGTIDSDKFLDTLDPNTNMASMIDQFIDDPYHNKWGNQRYALLKYIVDSGKAQPINTNPALQGFYYIPRANDRARATALVYNPSTQQMFETFIGNTHLWDNIMADFKRNQGWVDATSPYMRKEGGVLYAQQGASLGQDVANYIESLSRQNLEERAKKKGRTTEQQKASERYINSDNASMSNPNAGFTSVEVARLIGGVGDIASTIAAWAPGAGTAVSLGTGLASTGANLYADIMDDSVSAWDTVKNTGFNLGMDLVGLVPGGGSASKFAKIGKNIIGLAPKMIAALGTYSHLTNAPEYIASWKKLSTDDKLDAQDWTNIMASIQAVLGPAAGIGQYAKNKGYYGKNKVEAAKRVDTGTVNQDKVAVKMLDNTGKEKTVLFTGDDAVAIRKAQESGKLEDLKAATVDKFQDLDGWSLKETDFGFRRPQISINPTKWSPVGGKTITPNDLIADVVTRQGVDFARVRGFHDDVTSFHTPGRRWEDIDNAYIETQLQPLASKSAAYDRMLRMKDKAVSDYDSKIATANTNLANAKASGSNKTSAELDAKLQQMRKDKADGVHAIKQDEIINSQTNLTLAQKKLASAERKIKRLEKMEITATSETTRTAIRNQIEDAKIVRDAAIQEANNAQKIINENTKWLADNDDAKLRALETEFNSIKALEDAAKALKTDKAKWDKYTDTGKTKLREDFETNYPVDADGNITVQDPNTGRKITRNFKELLDKYSIKHKKGGIIKAGGGWKLNWEEIAQNTPQFQPVIPIQKEESITLPYRPGYTPEVKTETPVSQKNSLAAMNRVGEKNWLAVDNTYENARDINKWDNYYNNDAIFKDLESYMSTQDASKFIAAANALNSMNTDFSTKELNKKGYLAWNTEYNKTGLNKYFGSDSSKFDYLGPSTWNRNLLLKQIQEKYGTDGITMKDGVKVYFDGNQWTIKNPKPVVPPAAVVPTDDKTGTQIDVLENDQNSNQKEEEKNPQYKEFLNGVTNDTFLKYSLPRAWYADKVNRKITDMAIANERPFLQDPFQVHRTVKSDLDAEAWGQRAAAQMNNLTSKMITSDFGSYQGQRLEGFAKGLDYIIQGNEKSNQAMKASQELAWQQEKENDKSRHDIAQQNRLSMLQTMANKGKYEQAYQTKKHEIWDTLWKEKQYKEEEEIKKNEAYVNAFTKSEISDYVTSNLATLAPNLSEESIKLYQQVKKGLITPSSLSSDTTKYQLFIEAAETASKLEQEEFKKYKGIPDSKWSKVRNIASKKVDDSEFVIAKEGTKLRIQNSKVRTKNADRFAKQLKSDLDRNDKVLARLSKSIYNYIKGQIV